MDNLLEIATALLAAVALAGVTMGFVLLDSEGRRPPRAAWVRAHGAAGAVAAGLLAVALVWGPARGAATGTGSFGTFALALFVLAAPAGLAASRRIARAQKLGGLVAAVHATIAVTALALLITYVALG